MTGRYANIIVDISHEKVDRTFQYRIPQQLQGMLEAGMSVTVPFGKGNKEIAGYITEITDQAEYAPDKLKEITGMTPGGVRAGNVQIRLAWWIKEHYGSTMIAALKTVLPVKQKSTAVQKRRLHLAMDREKAILFLEECRNRHRTARARLLEALLEEETVPYELVTSRLHVTPAVIRALEQQGVLSVEQETVYRNPLHLKSDAQEKKALSEEQRRIVEEIGRECREKNGGVYLIHGITGSGKTEVYISLIEDVVKNGKQAIVLIPEIALTYQTVLRFYRRFGERASVFHSRLSKGERYDQCERAKKGELDVIIGPRSALFTPFSNLGLIVIDEEHENSYKSESVPKYHARETAVELASYFGAGVVLGSATPSLEAYYQAKQGRIKLYELTRRLTGGSLPTVYVEDLREELKKGNRSIFSRRLQELIRDRLAKKEQVMLFLNRRGYAGFISCRSCGHVMKCPHCDVSLSEHRNGKLVCHYCGFEQPAVKRCPECGSPYISGFRAGTEQIEEQLKRYFPEAAVLRMDADTTRKKDGFEKILTAFAEGEADILVGTQMIVKGHDFPEVTLMGVLAADLSLAANDYRAGERTFQLLTQAAGRAGRGTKAGEVVIQTYQPEHHSIRYAAAQDYKGFYEEEIMYRELLSYPPSAHMAAVLISSEEEERGKKAACRLAELAGEYGSSRGLQVIGPAPASVGKINDVYRHMLYLKHKDMDILIGIKNKMEQYIEENQWKKESVQFDFDPVNAY